MFNFLGPLANPARLPVVGGGDPTMAEKMIGVLAARGAERALVVYGHDGLDEITTTTTSTVLSCATARSRATWSTPSPWGWRRRRPRSSTGVTRPPTPDWPAGVLSGEPGARRDFILLNAAAVVVAGGLADDLAAGLKLAAEAIDDGRAAGVLDRLVRVSNEQAAAPTG